MDRLNKSNKNRKKIAIGIFGRSGEGKSSLLSAILGERYLLPSGSSGACTAITAQVEANLSDSNYTAEIELISKEVSLSILILYHDFLYCVHIK